MAGTRELGEKIAENTARLLRTARVAKIATPLGKGIPTLPQECPIWP